VIRYLRPDIAKTGGERDYAMLVRGNDQFGHWQSYSAPNQPFEPRAMSTYDEIRKLQTSVMMQGAKKHSNMYEKA
jgi:hypothetical protein